MSVDGWDALGDGVFQRTFESWQLNVGLVIGDERVAVVDTRATPAEGRELRRFVRQLTDRRPVVINTHAHLDHCLGNVAFVDVEMLAHPAAVTAMRSSWPDWLEQAGEADSGSHNLETLFVSPRKVAAPAEVDLGGRALRVRHYGRGHTDGDLVVEVIDANVVFAGDLVRQDRAPWFGDAHPLEWPATVTHMMLRHPDPTTWVPGHGAPMNGDNVLTQARLLDRVATVITECWHAKAPIAVAVNAVPLDGKNAQRAVARGYWALEIRFGEVPTPGA